MTVHVFAVACLPPGGGKSALFERPRALGARVVSSDECRRAEAQHAQRGGRGDGAAADFTQQLECAVRRAAESGAGADGAGATASHTARESDFSR